MYRSKPDLVIDEKTLYELHNLALKCPLKLNNYSYRETQQLFTLYALHEWISSYGITPQFGLELSQDVNRVRTED